MLDWQPAADGDDEDFDSSEQGSEDEPDWTPMDPADIANDDGFNATYRDDMASLVDTLQTLGVSAVDATRYASGIVHAALAKDPDPTFVELYGIGSIMRLAGGKMRNLNIRGHSAFDLRARKPDGTPWDFTQPPNGLGLPR